MTPPPVPYYGNVRKSRTILQLMSSLIVWREGRQRSLGAPALVALARRNARGCSDFLELLLDGGKVSKTLPAADGGALLVERVRPHHKGFGDVKGGLAILWKTCYFRSITLILDAILLCLMGS